MMWSTIPPSIKLDQVGRHGVAIISANPGKPLICTRDERIDRTKDKAVRWRKNRTFQGWGREGASGVLPLLANNIAQGLSVPSTPKDALMDVSAPRFKLTGRHARMTLMARGCQGKRNPFNKSEEERLGLKIEATSKNSRRQRNPALCNAGTLFNGFSF